MPESPFASSKAADVHRDAQAAVSSRRCLQRPVSCIENLQSQLSRCADAIGGMDAEDFRTHGSLHEMDVPIIIHNAPGAPHVDYFQHNLDLARWMYAA